MTHSRAVMHTGLRVLLHHLLPCLSSVLTYWTSNCPEQYPYLFCPLTITLYRFYFMNFETPKNENLILYSCAMLKAIARIFRMERRSSTS